MKSDFLIAVTQLMAERSLPQGKVLAAVEDALVSAFKKEGALAGHDITVRLNPNNGTIDVLVLKAVVEEVTDPKREMTLAEAGTIQPGAAPDDVLELPAPFQTMGRIAAQTAKQVVLQRLREAERELILEEYVNRVGEIFPGRVERVEAQNVVVNLGKTDAMMPREEQVPQERIRPSVTLQFYLVEVATTPRGPEIIVSRAHRNLVRRLFEREVPEIFKGIVEIKAIAREPGSRTKVAVVSRQEGVDPVGSCVGLRGFRIQNIVSELQGEKIDVVQWSENPATFLASAVSPAQVVHVDLDETEKIATIVVPDRQISLAIGKEGQNARLTARLTGWKIEIRGQEAYEQGATDDSAPREIVDPEAEEQALAEQATAVAVAEPAVAEPAVAEPAVAEPAIAEPAVVAEVEVPTQEAVAVAEPEPAVAKVVIEEVAAAPEPVTAAQDDAELTALAAEIAALEAEETPEAEEKEEVGLAPNDESLWVVPEVGAREPSVLRFAEDIMPERNRAREGRGRTRTDTPTSTPAPARVATKSKKGKRSRAPA